MWQRRKMHTHTKPSILASKPQTFPSKLDTRPPHPSRHHPDKAWAISYLVWENHAKARSSKQAWETGTIPAFACKSANEWHHIWKWLWLLATISVAGFMIFLKQSAVLFSAKGCPVFVCRSANHTSELWPICLSNTLHSTCWSDDL